MSVPTPSQRPVYNQTTSSSTSNASSSAIPMSIYQYDSSLPNNLLNEHGMSLGPRGTPGQTSSRAMSLGPAPRRSPKSPLKMSSIGSADELVDVEGRAGSAGLTGEGGGRGVGNGESKFGNSGGTGGGGGAAEKKSKACLGCRRSKHRCIPSSDPTGRCVRCIKRNEECKFKTRLHDDEWQEWVTEELRSMSTTIDDLKATIADLRASGPTSQPPPFQSLNANHSTTSQIPPAGTVVSSFNNHTTPPATSNINSTDLVGEMSSPRSPVDMIVATRFSDGVEEVMDGGRSQLGIFEVGGEDSKNAMMQVYAPPNVGHPIQQTSIFPGTTSFFPIDISQSMSIANAASFLEELGSLTQTASGGLRDPVDALGANDPRMNIIRKGVIDNRVADVLFDFFVENLSPIMYGFTIRTYEYPFLAAGKSTITPYILSVMSLVAAERLPAFHPLVPALAAETSAANLVELATATDPDVAEAYVTGETEDEPFFNVELGIGPEEITATSVLASFTTAPDSHIAAKAANEWARGFAKGDNSEDTRALTLGEMCGYLTPRRWPTRPQSIRLILFTFVVAVQQGIYRAAALPRFDPSRLCEELFQPWVNRTDREMMQDSVLVAHVRLALILQSWRKATDMPAGSSAASNVGIYQIVDFNTRLDRWMSELDQVGVASEHREYLAPIWLYARIVINMAGASVPHAESANLFCGNAMRAARSLVDLFGGERLMEQLPLLPPFYIEIYCLGCTILLMRISKTAGWPLAGDDEQVVNAIIAGSRRLVQGPLPRGHFAPLAGERLQNAVSGVKQRWRAMGAF